MRRVLIGAAATLLVLGSALPARAHGELVDARPRPGSTVQGLVVEIELMFEDELVLEDALVAVTAPNGAAVTTGEPVLPIATVLRVPIAALSAAGAYRVDYSVTSGDGFDFTGAYVFSIDPDGPAVEPFPYGRDDGEVPWLLLVGAVALFLVGGWLIIRLKERRMGDGGSAT